WGIFLGLYRQKGTASGRSVILWTSSLRTVTVAPEFEACWTTIHSYLCRPIVLVTANLTEEVYVFLLFFFYCLYLSWIRFLAETDRLDMSLFVAVTTNSVSSWARLPVMVLASTPKTWTVVLSG
ncbi:unnamed protein product, partial [Porites lobata]